ncbi:1766_t:CDS:2 [Scutellospora calospora]|uniref:1766_t:CDS:1 n=1 Tax=Scutellospora calospora TaxID=85575 RepID=A0ACA9JV40_9GLOM|nr:1766_t:CDS:2 [Scutellospora calospora]
MSQYIRVRQKVKCCCKECCYKNSNGYIVNTRTKKQYKEVEASFQNEFIKKRKINSYQTIYAKSSVQSKDNDQGEISLNDVNQSNIDEVNYTKLKPHKNKTELVNINKSNHFENIEFLNNNNNSNHFKNIEFLDNSNSIIENNSDNNSENVMLISSDDLELYEEIEYLKSSSVNPFHTPKVNFNKPTYIPESNINLDDLL